MDKSGLAVGPTATPAAPMLAPIKSKPTGTVIERLFLEAAEKSSQAIPTLNNAKEAYRMMALGDPITQLWKNCVTTLRTSGTEPIRRPVPPW